MHYRHRSWLRVQHNNAAVHQMQCAEMQCTGWVTSCLTCSTQADLRAGKQVQPWATWPVLGNCTPAYRSSDMMI